jgi:hypothetical protein
MSDSIEFHAAGEWTAVYLNGLLVRVGDHYLADEWLRARVGVVEVDDDAFMRGQDSRDAVAPNLAQVAEYKLARDKRLAEAADMRNRAQALLDAALKLEDAR